MAGLRDFFDTGMAGFPIIYSKDNERFIFIDNNYCDFVRKFVEVPIGTFLCKFLEYDFAKKGNLYLFLMAIQRYEAIQNTVPSHYAKYKKHIENPEAVDCLDIDAQKIYMDLHQELQSILLKTHGIIKNAIDYCINANEIDYLKDFSFTERFFIGACSYNGPLFEIYEKLFTILPNILLEDQTQLLIRDARIKKLSDMELSIRLKNQKISFDTFYEFYLITDIRDALYIEFQKLLQLGGTPIKKCKNCGNYFIPTVRSDEIYCDRVTNGKTCKDVGYLNKLKSADDMLADREYRKAYKTKNAQKQRLIKGKGKDFIKKKEFAFETWTENAKEKLRQTKQGSLEIDVFIDWLRKDWRNE